MNEAFVIPGADLRPWTSLLSPPPSMVANANEDNEWRRGPPVSIRIVCNDTLSARSYRHVADHVRDTAQSACCQTFCCCCCLPTLQLPKSIPAAEPVSLSRPLIFHVHGGGFVSMSSLSHSNYLQRWAKIAEAVVVSVDYRKAPEHPYV